MGEGEGEGGGGSIQFFNFFFWSFVSERVAHGC